MVLWALVSLTFLGHLGVIELLLDAGADRDIRIKKTTPFVQVGQTAADLAEANGLHELAARLRQPPSPPSPPAPLFMPN